MTETPEQDPAPPVPSSDPGRSVPGTVRPHQLLASFLRLGVTAFGGPAMVATIRTLAVERKSWLSPREFRRGVALCQVIPGATAMQAAAYVGLRAAGPAGALAAFVGFGLPATALMLALSTAYSVTHETVQVVGVLHGLHAIVVALVANAMVSFGRSSLHGWRDGFLAGAAAVFLVAGGNPILAIAGAALAGALLHGADRVHDGAAGGEAPLVGTWRPVGLLLGLFAASLVALYFVDPRLFALATVLARVDLFAFGGGFASLPIMLHEVVRVRGWMDTATFMDGIALGQVTPGPIVITATFVGYQMAGLPGALVATVAVFSPSFIALVASAPFLDRLERSILVGRAIRGVLASFVGLLAAVLVHLAVTAEWSAASVLIAVAGFVALRLGVNVAWVVLAGLAASVVLL